MLPAAAEASAAVTNEQASTELTWAPFVGLGVAPADELEVELADPPHAATSKQTVTRDMRPITMGP